MQLNALTQAFYEQNAASFSQTRERGWPGWQRVARECGLAAQQRLRLLDAACGNMRFLRFLEDELPAGSELEYLALDSCPHLAQAEACSSARPAAPDTATSISAPGAAPRTRATVRFQQIDLTAALTAASPLPVPACDLAVCFGFMHHIPLPAWRAELMRALADRTRPDGYIAIACWQFLRSSRLARKADEATRAGCQQLGIVLDDPNDKLLGWQDARGTYRYCHSFTESELSELAAAAPGTREVARFSADGSGALNRYLILQRSATSTR